MGLGNWEARCMWTSGRLSITAKLFGSGLLVVAKSVSTRGLSWLRYITSHISGTYGFSGSPRSLTTNFGRGSCLVSKILLNIQIRGSIEFCDVMTRNCKFLRCLNRRGAKRPILAHRVCVLFAALVSAFQFSKVLLDLSTIYGSAETLGTGECSRVRSSESSLIWIFINMRSVLLALFLSLIVEANGSSGSIAWLLLKESFFSRRIVCTSGCSITWACHVTYWRYCSLWGQITHWASCISWRSILTI